MVRIDTAGDGGIISWLTRQGYTQMTTIGLESYWEDS